MIPKAKPTPAALAETRRHLEMLGSLYPECTTGMQRQLFRRVLVLEVLGLTHFGGPEIFAWYLVHRALSKRPSWLQLVSYVEQLWTERTYDMHVM